MPSSQADAFVAAYLSSVDRLQARLHAWAREQGLNVESQLDFHQAVWTGALPPSGRFDGEATYSVHGRIGCLIVDEAGVDVDFDIADKAEVTFDVWRLQRFANSSTAADVSISDAEWVAALEKQVERGDVARRDELWALRSGSLEPARKSAEEIHSTRVRRVSVASAASTSANERGVAVVELDTDAMGGRKAFFDSVRSAVDLNPPVVSERSWDALSDSLWQALWELPARRIRVSWRGASDFERISPEDFRVAVSVLAEVAESLARAEMTAGSPKDVQVLLA